MSTRKHWLIINNYQALKDHILKICSVSDYIRSKRHSCLSIHTSSHNWNSVTLANQFELANHNQSKQLHITPLFILFHWLSVASIDAYLQINQLVWSHSSWLTSHPHHHDLKWIVPARTMTEWSKARPFCFGFRDGGMNGSVFTMHITLQLKVANYLPLFLAVT